MNIVTIIQARMGSTRLPGKVLQDLAGQTVLGRCVQRVQQAETISRVVIATTTESKDDYLADYCTAQQWHVYRGSENDVLDRYYQTAQEYNADVVVRVTSDCPLIDPGEVDRVVQRFLTLQPTVDYVANTLPPRTFPRGLDTEVFSFTVLERACYEDNDPTWREHVTPFIYRNPDKFSLARVTNNVDYSAMRWTVDTPEDLELVRRIYNHFGDNPFDWRAVLVLVAQHPDWQEINRHVEQKKVQ